MPAGTTFNTQPFMLKDGEIFVGTVSDPLLIGAPNGPDPASLFEGNSMGATKQGSTNVNINREYAEAMGFTPGVKLRKDLIRKDYMFTFECYQFEAAIFELAMGFQTKMEYEGANGFRADIMHVGSDEPTQPFYCYKIDSERTDGVPLIFMLFWGKITTEDNPVALTGTEHAIIPVQVEAFNHPAFAATGSEAQLHYGVWYIPIIDETSS